MCLEALFAQWFIMTVFCEVFIIAISLQLTERFANIRRRILRLVNVKVYA